MGRNVINVLVGLLVAAVLGVAGCGGGGGEATTAPGGATVSGVAAAGAPLVGTVFLKDSSTPAKELSGTIGADGSFSFSVDTLKSPFILKAQGTAGGASYTLYSFSASTGIANINPFANFLVANAAGTADLATIYSTPSAATMQSITTNLAKAEADIKTKLQPLFTLHNVTGNLVSGSYTANHLGLDGLLDTVKVDMSAAGTVTLTNKLTNAVICTGSVNNISTWASPVNIPQPLIVVNVTPETATVNKNGTATFTASVVNTTNTQVTWSVVETGGGTVTSSGVYTAPATVGTYHVKATSVADSTKSDSAAVTVTTGPVVTINPGTATVITNETDTFAATVTNSTNTQVTWSVVEVGGGTITQSGVYTAPATAGTYHVKAASSADPTKYATATVTVASVVVAVSPSSATVTANGTKSFSATVTGTSNTQVTWSVVEANGGSITSSGGYTAPATTGTYHVKAVSAADPNKSATAVVTVSAALQPFPLGTWVGPHNITITVNAMVTPFGTDNYYSGSVSYPAFSGGTVAISGGLIDAVGSINYVQKNVLAVVAFSVTGGAVTELTFSGDGIIEHNMQPPITTLAGQLIIVSTTPGYSYTERATFVKQ